MKKLLVVCLLFGTAGIGLALDGDLSPYVVGIWDIPPTPQCDPGKDWNDAPGFSLRIVNPTSRYRLAVVAVFDDDENLFGCARTLLSPDDLAVLRSDSPIWVMPGGEDPRGRTLAYGLRDLPGFPRSGEGVIEVVALKDNNQTLSRRIDDGLQAWIANVGSPTQVTYLCPSDPKAEAQDTKGLPTFRYVLALDPIPDHYLTTNNKYESLVGRNACGNRGQTTTIFE